MSFFENTRKPVGFSGKIMVAMMNFGHSAMAAWGLHFLQPAPDAMVLDCGCGGGANIKTLLKLCPRFIITTMIFPLKPTGLRVFSKKDISHLRFHTFRIGQRKRGL